jgi:hypothetical protein
MNVHRLAIVLAAVLAIPAGGVHAKLPAPNPTPEEKAKAAEAAARTAWSNKVADYQLCRSMERVAANYFEVAKKRGTAAAADPSAPACSDPGAFSYAPPDTKPVEAAGAHSPPGTASAPPSTKTPAAEMPAKK